MLNNYYFKETEEDSQVKKEFAGSTQKKSKFMEECMAYLKEAHNYSITGLMKDSGLTIQDLTELYEDDMSSVDFVELLMEELHHLRTNYFNIILSDRHPLIV